LQHLLFRATWVADSHTWEKQQVVGGGSKTKSHLMAESCFPTVIGFESRQAGEAQLLTPLPKSEARDDV
jgi:hypothetical protein